MRFSFDDLPASFVITAVLIFCGTAFQLGYFSNVGIEFLSMVSVSDWAVSIGVIAAPLAVFLPLLYKAMSWILERMQDGTWQETRFWKAWKFIDGMPWYFWGAVVTLLALWSALQTLWHTIFAPALSVYMLYLLAAYVNDHRRGVEITGSSIAFAFAQAGALMYIWGTFYAADIAGKSCLITTKKDGTIGAYYLRAVGQGHLIRTPDLTKFYSNDEVLKVECLRPGYKWKQPDPPPKQEPTPVPILQ